MERKALKIIVTRKADGYNLYPEFDLLDAIKDTQYPVTKAGGKDRWKFYVDRECGGWLRDNVTPMHKVAVDSPLGTHVRVILAPADFADQAASMFSETCTVLSDAEMKSFYEDKFAVIQPTEIIDNDVIIGLNAKVAAGKELSPEQLDMLDSTKPSCGIRPNPKKTWSGYKNEMQITMV
jgi:hypothetical protein